MTIYLGTDPEFVALKGNKPYPVHKFGFPNVKEKGKSVPRGKYGRDGFNAELNLSMAHTCRESFVTSVQQVFRGMEKALPKGYRFDTRPAFAIDLRSIEKAPPDVRQFGCEPSWDAYTGDTKLIEVSALEHPFRYTGGHMHFSGHCPRKNWQYPALGYTSTTGIRAFNSPQAQRNLIKLFDVFIGYPLTFLFHEKEQFQRRKLYGQAGEYRPQIYDKGAYRGVEYRTPPSSLFNHQALVSLFYGVGRWVVQNYPRLLTDYNKLPAKVVDDIKRYINTGEGSGSKYIQRVPGFYDEHTIRQLARRPEIRKFNLVKAGASGLSGWRHFSHRWNIDVPESNESNWG